MEEHIMSKFNEAAFQMKRADTEQSLLNYCKKNLTAMNIEFQTWNYNVVFDSLTTLYTESKSKFKPEEIEEVERWKKAIEKFLRSNPIQKRLKQQSKNGKLKVDFKNLTILKDCLFQYETLIRKYRDEHGLSSPNAEDDDGL